MNLYSHTPICVVEGLHTGIVEMTIPILQWCKYANVGGMPIRKIRCSEITSEAMLGTKLKRVRTRVVFLYKKKTKQMIQ